MTPKKSGSGLGRGLSALLDGLAVQVLVHRNLTKKQLALWVRGAAAHELGIDPSRLT